jgi:hypothetical protein
MRSKLVFPENLVGEDPFHPARVERGKSLFGHDRPAFIHAGVRMVQTRQQRLDDRGAIDSGQGKGGFQDFLRVSWH